MPQKWPTRDLPGVWLDEHFDGAADAGEAKVTASVASRANVAAARATQRRAANPGRDRADHVVEVVATLTDRQSRGAA